MHKDRPDSRPCRTGGSLRFILVRSGGRLQAPLMLKASIVQIEQIYFSIAVLRSENETEGTSSPNDQ